MRVKGRGHDSLRTLEVEIHLFEYTLRGRMHKYA